MISPLIDTPAVQREESLEIVYYELTYPSIVEHRFTKVLFLPVTLKISNRTNAQQQVQLHLLR